jgi:hypothetical protein
MLPIISRRFVLDVRGDTLVCDDNPLSAQFNFSIYISLVLLSFFFWWTVLCRRGWVVVHCGRMHWKGGLGWVNWSFRFHVLEKEWNGDGLFGTQSMVPMALGQQARVKRAKLEEMLSRATKRTCHDMMVVRYANTIVGTLSFTYNYNVWIGSEMCDPISNCETHIYCHVKFCHRSRDAYSTWVQTDSLNKYTCPSKCRKNNELNTWSNFIFIF